MIDILGAVNSFILAYVSQGNELPALQQSQIVRGWQNAVSALPYDSQEYAVLTLLEGGRRGTNVHKWEDPADGGEGLTETVMMLVEDSVQVDFCCASPQSPEYAARTRANILAMLARDAVGVDFFTLRGISACYADNIRSLPFTNEAEQWVARYSVTLTLTHWESVQTPRGAFRAVDIYLENVDVHHPILTEENQS